MISQTALQISARKTPKLFVGTGATQIVFGILLIITSILDLFLSCSWIYGLSVVGSGIWAGAVILTAGAVGVAASKKRQADKCLLDAYLGMNIVAAIFSVAPIACGITGLTVFSTNSHYCTYWAGGGYYFYYGNYICTMVFNSLLLTFGTAILITSIVGSVYVCEVKKQKVLTNGPMVIQTSNGPMMLVPVNPSAFQASVEYQPNFQLQQPANHQVLLQQQMAGVPVQFSLAAGQQVISHQAALEQIAAQQAAIEKPTAPQAVGTVAAHGI